MRRTIAWWSLLVFDRTRHLRVDVLNQSSTARDVQHLHPETDREDRYSSSFRRGNDQQIRFVFDCLDRAELWMRLLAIPQRIDVGVAAGQQDAVELCDYGIDVVGLRNQTDVYRKTARGLDSLAVVASQIESIGCLFDAHRDADAWSCLYHSVRSNSLHRYHNLCEQNCVTTTRKGVHDLHCNEFL